MHRLLKNTAKIIKKALVRGIFLLFIFNPVFVFSQGILISSGITTLPSEREATSAVFAPNTNKIYIFGGVIDYGATYYSDIFQFDPIDNSILTLSTALPSGRSRASAVYAPNTGKIYIFGGYNSGTYYSDILQFNPIDNSISVLSAALPTGRADTAVAYAENVGKIYIFGGLNKDEPCTEYVHAISDIIGFDPLTNSTFTVNASVPNDPRAASSISYAPDTEKIYILGGAKTGCGWHSVTGEVLEFDPQTSSITVLSSTLPPLFKTGTGRYYVPAIYEPNEGLVYIPGGMNNSGTSISSIAVFNPKTETFGTLNITLPRTMSLMSADYVPATNSMYIFGGKYCDNLSCDLSDIIQLRFYPLFPPSGFTSSLTDDSKALLNWNISPSTDVAQYNIYWDSGTGVIDYAVKLTTVSSNTSSFISDILSSTGTYRFAIRAQALNGAEEQNFNIVASVFVPEIIQNIPKAIIKIPHSGKKIGGNRITIMAEIISGDLNQVKQVEFQYRSAVSTTAPWNIIPFANINHPNPDAVSPYFIHWNISGMADGDYELRAIAMDLTGTTDINPSAITITIDNTNPDSEEKIVANILQKRELVFNTISQTIKVGDETTNSITQITLPLGILSNSSDTLKIIVNPIDAPVSESLLVSAGQAKNISLESGQTILNNPAEIILQYQNTDNDGYVDGTLARIDKLALYRYDMANNKWLKLGGNINKTNKTVMAQTTRFSFFGLFAPASADLSNILVYPVPFVPNDGNADNGKPYVAGDNTSGIIFDNLTQSVKIEIYTLTGELVWKKTTDTSSGKLQWDVKNSAGRTVASGGYFAVITNPSTGAKVKRKIAIVR